MEDDGENLTWEEKYYQAEQQIQKFRSQAGRVRELLSEKVQFFTCSIFVCKQFPVRWVVRPLSVNLIRLECRLFCCVLLHHYMLK